MHPLVTQHLADVRRLCEAHRVARLWLFGSAATPDFDAAASDVDFVVEFEPMPTSGYARNYLRLCEALERQLGRPVHVVERIAIDNPYFQRAFERTRVPVYDAA